MPHRTYMVVDPRRDHSLRIPRPDLSEKLGTPNACTQCHADQDNRWAAEAFKEWYGDDHPRHYGEVFHAAAENRVGADLQLIQLASNPDLPAIVRATAARQLGQYQSREAFQAVKRLSHSEDPLIREACAAASEAMPPSQRIATVAPLLSDPTRLVRIEAARVLSATDKNMMPLDILQTFTQALEEYRASLHVIRSNAGAHMAFGLLHTNLGEQTLAEEAYLQAVALDPKQYQVRVNLADLYYRMGQTEKGKPHLEAALKYAPDSGLVHQAMGFYHIRMKNYQAAANSLIKAAELLPTDARVQFFCGVALNQVNRFKDALPYLKKAHELERFNIEYLSGLATICRDHGERDLALKYAQRLQKMDPLNPGYRQLIQSILATPPATN
jgi:tetratricopeptide (TPR) repeat protein